jgi:hypothetical protein
MFAIYRAVSPSFIRLSKISFSFIFLVHVVACGYWLVVDATCTFCDEAIWNGKMSFATDCRDPMYYDQPSFTTQSFCPSVYKTSTTDKYGLGHEATLNDKYLFAFYWACMAMLGDNAGPESNNQLMFSISMSMIGIVVFSTVIGSLSAVLSNLDSAAAAKQDQLDSVNSYLSYRKIDPDLKLRIRGFYKYLWASGQSTHHQSMFEELPQPLAYQLNLALKEDLVVTGTLLPRAMDN